MHDLARAHDRSRNDEPELEDGRRARATNGQARNATREFEALQGCSRNRHLQAVCATTVGHGLGHEVKFAPHQTTQSADLQAFRERSV
jgi:hypothetical protein